MIGLLAGPLPEPAPAPGTVSQPSSAPSPLPHPPAPQVRSFNEQVDITGEPQLRKRKKGGSFLMSEACPGQHSYVGVLRVLLLGPLVVEASSLARVRTKPR